MPKKHQEMEKNHQVLEENLSILKDANEVIVGYQGGNMMADGLIDSFGIIQLIDNLEDVFDAEVDTLDVVVDNFANADAVIQFVKRLVSRKTGN